MYNLAGTWDVGNNWTAGKGTHSSKRAKKRGRSPGSEYDWRTGSHWAGKWAGWMAGCGRSYRVASLVEAFGWLRSCAWRLVRWAESTSSCFGNRALNDEGAWHHKAWWSLCHLVVRTACGRDIESCGCGRSFLRACKAIAQPGPIDVLICRSCWPRSKIQRGSTEVFGHFLYVMKKWEKLVRPCRPTGVLHTQWRTMMH